MQGELSALNGIAGAYSEQVKVIHVVGQTTRHMQKNRMLIHHAISNDPDHKVRSNGTSFLFLHILTYRRSTARCPN